ncbi:hypothetical protein ABK040_014926 [Willaertia magna]
MSQLKPKQIEETEELEAFHFSHRNEKLQISLEKNKSLSEDENSNCSLLTISNALQVLAFATDKSIKLITLNNVHKKLHEESSGYNSQISYDLEITPDLENLFMPNYLKFSNDGKTLIAIYDCFVFTYEFNIENNNKIILTKTLKYTCNNTVSEIDCSKINKLFVVVNNDCLVLDYSGSSIVPKTLKSIKNVSSISSFSDNYEQNHLLVGTETGCICLIDYDSDKLLSKQQIEKCEKRKISSLYWFDKNYAIGYGVFPFDVFERDEVEEDDKNPYILLFKLDTSTTEEIVKDIFFSVCFFFDTPDRENCRIYYRYLKNWNVLVTGCSSDSKLVLFSKEEDEWKQLNLTHPVDSFPLGENDSATYPLGLDIDLCLSEGVPKSLKSDDKYPASPLVNVLITSGLLCLYSLINTKDQNAYPEIVSTVERKIEKATEKKQEIKPIVEVKKEVKQEEKPIFTQTPPVENKKQEEIKPTEPPKSTTSFTTNFSTSGLGGGFTFGNNNSTTSNTTVTSNTGSGGFNFTTTPMTAPSGFGLPTKEPPKDKENEEKKPTNATVNTNAFTTPTINDKTNNVAFNFPKNETNKSLPSTTNTSVTSQPAFTIPLNPTMQQPMTGFTFGPKSVEPTKFEPPKTDQQTKPISLQFKPPTQNVTVQPQFQLPKEQQLKQQPSQPIQPIQTVQQKPPKQPVSQKVVKNEPKHPTKRAISSTSIDESIQQNTFEEYRPPIRAHPRKPKPATQITQRQQLLNETKQKRSKELSTIKDKLTSRTDKEIFRVIQEMNEELLIERNKLGELKEIVESIKEGYESSYFTKDDVEQLRNAVKEFKVCEINNSVYVGMGALTQEYIKTSSFVENLKHNTKKKESLEKYRRLLENKPLDEDTQNLQENILTRYHNIIKQMETIENIVMQHKKPQKKNVAKRPTLEKIQNILSNQRHSAVDLRRRIKELQNNRKENKDTPKTQNNLVFNINPPKQNVKTKENFSKMRNFLSNKPIATVTPLNIDLEEVLNNLELENLDDEYSVDQIEEEEEEEEYDNDEYDNDYQENYSEDESVDSFETDTNTLDRSGVRSPNLSPISSKRGNSLLDNSYESKNIITNNNKINFDTRNEINQKPPQPTFTLEQKPKPFIPQTSGFNLGPKTEETKQTPFNINSKPLNVPVVAVTNTKNENTIATGFFNDASKKVSTPKSEEKTSFFNTPESTNSSFNISFNENETTPIATSSQQKPISMGFNLNQQNSFSVPKQEVKTELPKVEPPKLSSNFNTAFTLNKQEQQKTTPSFSSTPFNVNKTEEVKPKEEPKIENKQEKKNEEKKVEEEKKSEILPTPKDTSSNTSTFNFAMKPKEEKKDATPSFNFTVKPKEEEKKETPTTTGFTIKPQEVEKKTTPIAFGFGSATSSFASGTNNPFEKSTSLDTKPITINSEPKKEESKETKPIVEEKKTETLAKVEPKIESNIETTKQEEKKVEEEKKPEVLPTPKETTIKQDEKKDTTLTFNFTTKPKEEKKETTPTTNVTEEKKQPTIPIASTSSSTIPTTSQNKEQPKPIIEDMRSPPTTLLGPLSPSTTFDKPELDMDDDLGNSFDNSFSISNNPPPTNNTFTAPTTNNFGFTQPNQSQSLQDIFASKPLQSSGSFFDNSANESNDDFPMSKSNNLPFSFGSSNQNTNFAFNTQKQGTTGGFGSGSFGNTPSFNSFNNPTTTAPANTGFGSGSFGGSTSTSSGGFGSGSFNNPTSTTTTGGFGSGGFSAPKATTGGFGSGSFGSFSGSTNTTQTGGLAFGQSGFGQTNNPNPQTTNAPPSIGGFSSFSGMGANNNPNQQSTNQSPFASVSGGNFLGGFGSFNTPQQPFN